MQTHSRFLQILICICCWYGQWGIGWIRAEVEISRVEWLGDGIAMSWAGSDGFVEVQWTDRLDPGEWNSVLRTDVQSALFPAPGRLGFYRVVELADWESRLVSDSRRLAILEEIGQFIATLPGDLSEADAEAMRLFLETIPELEAVGISEGDSVVGRFTDGRSLIIMNDRPPASDDELAVEIELGPAPVPGVGLSMQSSAPQRLANVRSTGIPASRRAVLFQATVPGIAAPMLPSMIPAFQARGYEVVGGEASLQNLMGIENYQSDIGVFYIDTHGGLATLSHFRPSQSSAGRGIFIESPKLALMTSTHVTRESEALLYSEFNKNELIYALPGPSIRSKGIVVVPRAYYCITEEFVKNRWSFSDKSLIYIDTCMSSHPRARTFMQACLDKGGSVYAGWSDSIQDVWAYFATRLFFDISLGGSQIFTRVQPRQRPFDMNAIRTYLSARGYDVDQSKRSKGAQLRFFPESLTPQDFGLLVPTLQNLSTDESQEIVYLNGLFDTEFPVMVQVQGSQTKEIEVFPSRISQAFITLPGDQEPSVGYVTATQAGRTSNTIPLTEWRVQASLVKTFSTGQDEPSITTDFNLRFRFDVHRWRRKPFEEPIYGGSGGNRIFGSTAQVVNASGIYRQPDRDRTVEWILPSILDVPFIPVDRHGFRGSLNISPDDSAQISVSVYVPQAFIYKETIDGIVSENLTLLTTGNFPPGEAILDRSGFTIAAGQGSTAGNAGTFTWGTVQSTYPPDNSIPGYAE